MLFPNFFLCVLVQSQKDPTIYHFSVFVLSLMHRANSFYDRQDSVRSGYLSDRESRTGGYGGGGSVGMVQQASIESTDSRLCYLTSSEVSDTNRIFPLSLCDPCGKDGW